MRDVFQSLQLDCCEISLPLGFFAVGLGCFWSSVLLDFFAFGLLCCGMLWASSLWGFFAVCLTSLLLDFCAPGLLCFAVGFCAVTLLCCLVALLLDFFALRLLCSLASWLVDFFAVGFLCSLAALLLGFFAVGLLCCGLLCCEAFLLWDFCVVLNTYKTEVSTSKRPFTKPSPGHIHKSWLAGDRLLSQPLQNYCNAIYTGVVTLELVHWSWYTGVVAQELLHRSCYAGVATQQLLHRSCYTGVCTLHLKFLYLSLLAAGAARQHLSKRGLCGDRACWMPKRVVECELVVCPSNRLWRWCAPDVQTTCGAMGICPVLAQHSAEMVRARSPNVCQTGIWNARCNPCQRAKTEVKLQLHNVRCKCQKTVEIFVIAISKGQAMKTYANLAREMRAERENLV